MCYCPTPTLHLNLAFTGDGAFLDKKNNNIYYVFLNLLVYRDIGSVLINHLLVVIPMLLYRFVSS